jgi:hypothetical protein
MRSGLRRARYSCSQIVYSPLNLNFGSFLIMSRTTSISLSVKFISPG